MFTVKLILNFTIMLKNILNLNGAQQLSKNEQKSVNGGGPFGVSKGGGQVCSSFCTENNEGAFCRTHEDCPLVDGQCTGVPGQHLPL
jgi:hypothetical protein